MTDFVSLHNRSCFSILTALPSPKDYMVRAKELDQSAVAITDLGTLAGVWDALKASREVGIKLIIGAEFYFTNERSKPEPKMRFVVLIAKSAIGYKNLLKLNREGFDSSILQGKRIISVIDWELLKSHSEGVICLTGCGNGIVGSLINNKEFNKAEETMLKLSEIFVDDLGIEIQTHNLHKGETHYSGSVDQIFTNNQLIRLATKHNLRIVPTTNSHYIKREDAEIHDVMLAIGSMQPVYSNARLKYDVSDLYLKSGDEVKEFFARGRSEELVEQWCANSVYLANKCEVPDWIDPKYSNPTGKELPVFPVEKEADYGNFKNWVSRRKELQEMDEDKAYLRFRCNIAFFKKVPTDKHKEYRERLKEEFDVIEFHGFSSYMLIVGDYIEWARKNNIRAGIGRGSAGGSLIAYLLDIHQSDPIKYGLIFARFHNKDKTAFPDIDSDFHPEGRILVQDYIRKKYGSENVAHVSNINTITPKVFARDIARSCELAGNRQDSVKLGDELSASIPKKIGEKEVRTYKEALDKSPLFSAYVEKYTKLEKYSPICGAYRAWSTHAGGIIISKRPLAGLIPLRKDKDNAIAIEFEKNAAEENGLIKMDILGIETLGIIDETYRLIKEAGKPIPPDPPDFDEYDKETYDLISRGDTFCIFQLGTSSGTIDLCRKVKPKTIDDISHINSLARPSARNIREDFVATKEGKMKVKLIHPSLQRAFGDTFGFGLYEESLMYLAQDVAGWTLHEADRLRKLTKEKGKNPKKALQWRSEFIADAKKNKNIDEKISIKIWDEIVEPFGGYGFPKAHSILYSLTAYHTAYLKAHYPIEFLLANLMSETRSNTEAADQNIEKIKQEIRNNNVKILPPDINKSDMTYKLQPDGSLLTGLDALKSVGNPSIQNILETRPFKSFHEFITKVDTRQVRSTTIQSLVSCGCLDSFGLTRKAMYLYCGDYRKRFRDWSKKHDPNTETFIYDWPESSKVEWSKQELYALEKSFMGEGFACKKIEAYGGFFNKQSMAIKDVRLMKDKEAIPSMICEVRDLYELLVKKETSKYLGQPMMKATVEDAVGDQISLTIFPDNWKKTKARIKDLCGNRYKFDVGLVIHFSGTINIYEDQIGVVLDNVYAICPPPPLPKDLEAKKTIKRQTKIKEQKGWDIKNTKDFSEELFDDDIIDNDEEENDENNSGW